jgi:hypothetical protein
MTTYRFDKVEWQASKRLPCPNCGKRVRRQTTLWQTVNPWNKNPDGEPKTQREILAELREQAAEWEQKPEQCTPCRDGGAS